MGNFNVGVSLNKKQTMFFASIRNEKGEVLKELVEEVGSMGPKLHQKLLNRKCIDWVKYEYEEPAENIPVTSVDISGSATTTESISGGFTTTEATSGASVI
jgi:DNA-directed RNA polymerase subunit L